MLRDKYKLVDEEASSLADFLNSLLEVMRGVIFYSFTLAYLHLSFCKLQLIYVLDCSKSDTFFFNENFFNFLIKIFF